MNFLCKILKNVGGGGGGFEELKQEVQNNTSIDILAKMFTFLAIWLKCDS
jgi:hypothetical protein